ncbi:MAG: hypothetical protein IPI97_01510 [Nitrosomonas sp.]|jgi:hypothetical protein|nr:hypothetical protein [Nitrosomonas sp.]MBK7363729.1 hypothetical protein [Nitrosomonas sp.]MCC7091649.1 hypothetical protein [Nitrosomonas sp.]
MCLVWGREAICRLPQSPISNPASKPIGHDHVDCTPIEINWVSRDEFERLLDQAIKRALADVGLRGDV